MSTRTNLIRFAALLFIIGMLFSACGGAGSASEPTELKIAMALPGPINDNDFNTVGYSGLKEAAEELGLEYTYVEKVADADVERVLRDFASRGYGLIFAHSFSYASATLAVAEDFPNSTFMCAGSGFPITDNMGTYDNPDYQGAYLAGMLAAGISETGVVGWVDGNSAPNMLANLHAFEYGAQEMDPDVDVLYTFIGSWFDPPKAKEAAIAQVEQGADVLSAQGVGVIDAAVEKDVWVIGAMTDQNHLGPDVVLTSITWDIAPVVKGLAETVMDGAWESKTYSYGIKEGAVKIGPFHGLDENVPDDVMQMVNDKMEAIKDGSFTVPQDTSEVQ